VPGRDPDNGAVTEVHSPMAGGGDNCPQCGKPLAKDQRYCLNCGARRGDPRLPFMDAVVFMDSVKQPQPGAEGDGGKQAAATPTKRPLLSANASLIAGVATLVLAIGVGVLIGKDTGGGNSEAAASPQIIRVGGSGSGEEEATESATADSGKSKKEGKGGSKTKKAAKAKTKTESNGASAALNDVYKSKTPLAKPTIQPGEKCEKGTAGCSNSGEFDGSFFGE
jgi:hypothetical protein